VVCGQRVLGRLHQGLRRPRPSNDTPMDARLRNLFSRRSQKHDQLRLKAHPYESTVKQQSPIKGQRPIAGNGPYHLENVALESQELGAEPPNVPRSRADSYSSRPRTAPQSPQFRPYRRIRSGFSTKSRSTSSKYGSPYNPAPAPVRVRSVSAFSLHSLRNHKRSAHVDILDAVTWINPSTQILIQKRIASGKRDYGEDVADRNIAEYGGDEFPQQDGHSHSGDDAAHSQGDPSEVHEWQGRPDSREQVDTRDGSTWAPISQPESDGAGDDTTLLNQRTKYSASQVYSHANPNPSNPTLPVAAHSHARREFGNSEYNSDGMRKKGRLGRSSSASLPPHAITSANIHYTSGRLNRSVSTNESPRKLANSSQPIRRTNERGTQTTPPPPEPIVASPVVPVTITSHQDTEGSGSDICEPRPISGSRSSKRTILLTPPVSPTTGGSPTTSIRQASLEKGLPPPQPGAQISSGPKRHSRGGSASYSICPPQESGRNANAAGPATAKASVNSGATILLDDNKRDGLVSGGSPEPPRLEDIVDTSNTTDTEFVTQQLPGTCLSFVLISHFMCISLISSSRHP
jgi:hypothetical protein